jgi:acetoacetyl-CoA reductase
MLYLHAMPTDIFKAWNQAAAAALGSMVKVAKLNNEMMEQIARQQLYDWHTCLRSGTRCIHLGWEILLPEYSEQANKRAHVALVTGGMSGIGTAICKKLAEAGHFVVATHLGSEREFAKQWQAARRSEGYELDLVECDVTDFESCARMAEQIHARFGAVDILVNCVGITRDKTLHTMDKDSEHSVVDTHLDSVFNVTRNVIDGMIERCYGRIINISSVSGQKGQFGQTHYSATKAGMLGFTKSLARELADQGITVNSVSPAYVATSLVMAIPEEVRQRIIAKIPLGCLGEPEEIAYTVAFLADEKSNYITGADIAINSGLCVA